MIEYHIQNLQEKGRKLMKVSTARRDARWNEEVQSWNEKMFDVSGCLCFDGSVAVFGDLSKMKEKRLDDPEAFNVTMNDIRRACVCKTRIPYDEWLAYCDQKLRIGVLGPVDALATARLQARQQREQERERREREEESRRQQVEFIDPTNEPLFEGDVPDAVEHQQVEDDDPNDPADPDFLTAQDSQVCNVCGHVLIQGSMSRLLVL